MQEKNKKFKKIEHLSDTGIEFYGRTLEELFENAATGMFSIITDLSNVKKIKNKKINISGKNLQPEELLILWLEKFLYLFEVENMIYSKFLVKRIFISGEESSIESEAWGEKADSRKHEIIISIKAPTYHRLGIKHSRKSGTWKGTVIFDV